MMNKSLLLLLCWGACPVLINAQTLAQQAVEHNEQLMAKQRENLRREVERSATLFAPGNGTGGQWKINHVTGERYFATSPESGTGRSSQGLADDPLAEPDNLPETAYVAETKREASAAQQQAAEQEARREAEKQAQQEKRESLQRARDGKATTLADRALRANSFLGADTASAGIRPGKKGDTGAAGFLASDLQSGNKASVADADEIRATRRDAGRQAGIDQANLDDALDSAQKLHDTAARQVPLSDSFVHPDLGGAPLSQTEINDARTRVLNGQALSPKVAGALEKIQSTNLFPRTGVSSSTGNPPAPKPVESVSLLQMSGP